MKTSIEYYKEMQDGKSLGQIAYEAYCEFVGGVSIRGEILPPFENIPQNIKDACEHSAEIINEVVYDL